MSDDLRAALERLVADVRHADARAILRISAAIAPRADPATYWEERGKQRFARELTNDGVPPELIARALETVDEVLGGTTVTDDVSLDQILADLRRRSS
jgi:hypothetical protein